jgi:transcriptional regulator with XRE-family HTH domain
MRTAKARASEADQRIGIYLREVRRSRGISLIWLAEQLGVTYQQLRKYETGQTRLYAGRLLQMLELLGVDLREFAAAIRGGAVR